MARWASLAAGVLILGLVVHRSQGWRRGPQPLEEVGRDRLVLREGRWMKTDETNVFTGVMLEFYPDGAVQSRSGVSEGLLHGVSEGWWTNGVLAVRETFQAGRSHGVRTKWDIAGHRIAETMIREGKIEGWHREWHTNGQMSLEVAMNEGRPHGLSRKWTPEGALAGQWSLSNGVVQRAVTNTAELQGLAQQGGRL
ncbi:MAG: toxin-antitoxin system YwqK family antitoxin [Verrucomicrobiota bacterium]